MLDVLETMTLPADSAQGCECTCGAPNFCNQRATVRRFYPTYWRGPKPKYLCDDCRKAQDKQWREEMKP